MHRQHIEYVVRRLHYLKTERRSDSPDFRPTGDWYMTNCLLSRWTHQPKYEGHVPMDNNPSMGIKEQEGISTVHCFSCKFKSGLLGLVQEFARYAIPEGMMTTKERDDLIAYIALAEEDDTLVIHGKEHKRVVPVPDDVLECLGELYDGGADYAESRGIEPEDVELWKLGYSEKYRRLMFPIIDYFGHIPMVQGRTVDEVTPDNPKYKNYPSGVEKQHYLYGEHLITEETETLLVMEGMLDVISANRHLRKAGLFPKVLAVGLMGSEPHGMQLQKIIRWAKEAVPFGDNDAPGKLMNKKLEESLKDYMEVSRVYYPEGYKDPDELGERVIEVYNNRRNWLQDKLESMFQRGAI